MADNRTDQLTQIVVNCAGKTADVQVTTTITDPTDGTTVAKVTSLTDQQAVNAYNAGVTQTFIQAALAYVNSLRAAGAPPVTIP